MHRCEIAINTNHIYLRLYIDTLHQVLPKFSRKRREVKSVDAAKDAVMKHSGEFSKFQNESYASLHPSRPSNRINNMYGSPKLFVVNPNSFLRRNYSEQKYDVNVELKRSTRGGYSKPLSLMSSMKKFEVDPEDVISKEIKPVAARNLLKRK